MAELKHLLSGPPLLTRTGALLVGLVLAACSFAGGWLVAHEPPKDPAVIDLVIQDAPCTWFAAGGPVEEADVTALVGRFRIQASSHGADYFTFRETDADGRHFLAVAYRVCFGDVDQRAT